MNSLSLINDTVVEATRELCDLKQSVTSSKQRTHHESVTVSTGNGNGPFPNLLSHSSVLIASDPPLSALEMFWQELTFHNPVNIRLALKRIVSCGKLTKDKGHIATHQQVDEVTDYAALKCQVDVAGLGDDQPLSSCHFQDSESIVICMAGQ